MAEQKYQRDSFLFSMELAVYSGLALVGALMYTDEGIVMANKGFFYAFTPWTVLPIVVNGVGGLIVGLVMKYAGGVQKGFSIMGGIILTG